jgi:hypothetical protein|tara:strand:- start:130 stop:525 length:396 start_codon:yes stop_codon:yes gene_type:complete
MITEKIFKKIIQTQFALIITTFVLVVFETEIYPLVDEDLSFTFSDSIALMWAIGYIISIRLLYKFKPLGKKLYVIILILGLIMTLLGNEDFFIIEYTSFTPFIYAFENLIFLVDGIILASLFLTTLKEKFS